MEQCLLVMRVPSRHKNHERQPRKTKKACQEAECISMLICYVNHNPYFSQRTDVRANVPMKSATMVRAPMHMPPKAAAVGM